MNKLILSCESTIDMPYAYCEKRNMPVIFYKYMLGDAEYEDDMLRVKEAKDEYYKLIKAGKKPSTSQLNIEDYVEFFEKIIKQGDVLHIAFGSGMSGSVFNAIKAAEQVQKKHPNKTIKVIDSTCSSSGYGLLVDYAADLRDEGKSLDEIVKWIETNKKQVHHQFFSTDLSFFRRSGRMTATTSLIGTILGICPLMRLNESGHIIAYDKVRGKKNAVIKTIDEMEHNAVGGLNYSGKCFISQSNFMEEAQYMKEKIEARFPNLVGKVRIYDIGAIITSHCGPGTVALFFMGNTRKE